MAWRIREAAGWSGGRSEAYLRRGSPAVAAPDPALVSERSRLITRFAFLQSELGGLFYEMAIRDHVRMDVLMPKAAALQRVELELAQVERLIADDDPEAAATCSVCGTLHVPTAAFCSRCGASASP